MRPAAAVAVTEMVKKRFYVGDRRSQVLHTRIRVKNSDLNKDLEQRNIKPDAKCDCGNPLEDASHYLLSCPDHNVQRAEMIRQLHQIQIFNINTDILLYGDDNMTEEINSKIIQVVQNFIKQSKRFG